MRNVLPERSAWFCITFQAFYVRDHSYSYLYQWSLKINWQQNIISSRHAEGTAWLARFCHRPRCTISALTLDFKQLGIRIRHSLTACNHRCCCGDDADPQRGVHQPPALLGGEELHVDLAFGVNTSFGLTESNSTPFSFNCLLIIEANASAKTVPMADSSSTAPTTVLNWLEFHHAGKMPELKAGAVTAETGDTTAIYYCTAMDSHVSWSAAAAARRLQSRSGSGARCIPRNVLYVQYTL